MQIIKRIVYALIAVLIIALLAIYALIFFVDPNKYRSTIETLARDKANISLEIDGDLKWSLYPWLGISVVKTDIAALSDIEKPIASVESMEFSLKLIPLIQGNFEIDRLLIDGLKVNIEKRSDGTSNIDGFFRTKKRQSEVLSKEITSGSVATNNQNTTPVNHSQKGHLNIRLIEVQNSQFLLSNLMEKITITGDNINFTIQNIDAESPYFFVEKLQFLDGNFKYQNNLLGQSLNYQSIKFEMDNLLLNQQLTNNIRQYYWGIEDAKIRQGTITFNDDLSGKRWKFNPGEITVGKSFLSTFDEHLTLPWQINSLAVQALDFTYQKSNDSTPISLSETELTIPNLQPKTDSILNFTAIFQQGEKSAVNLKAETTLFIDIKDSILKFTNTHISAIEQDQSQKPINLEIKSDITLNIGKKQVIFLPLALKLNDDQLQGNLTLTNFEKPTISVKLSGDSLNLNAWMAENNTKTTDHSSNSNRSQKSTENNNIPQKNENNIFSATKDLTINFDLSLKELFIHAYRFTNPHAKGNLIDEILTVNQISAGILGGEISGNTTINGRKATPTIKAHINAESLPLQNLFKVANKDFPVIGNLFLTGDLASQGNKLSTLIQQLSGSVQFRVQQGQLLGVNYQSLACEGIASIQKVAFTKNQNSQSTPFTQLRGTASVKNGILQNQNLTIEIPGLSASGKGTINLNNETLDYQISLLFTEAGTISHQCAIDSYLKGVSIPLRCQGSFNGNHSNLCGLDQNALGILIASFAKKTIENEIKSSIKENLPIFNQDHQNEKVPDIFKPDTLKKAVEGLFKF